MKKYRPRKYKRRRRVFRFKWDKQSLRMDNKAIWISFFAIFFLAGIVYLGKIVYESSIFRVREINSNLELSSDIKRSVIGKSLFALNINKVYSEIKEQYPECKKVYVKKEFPNVLKVEVEKRIPVVQLRKKRFYPIDEEAVIIDDGSHLELPGLVSVEIEDYDAVFEKGNVYNDARISYVFELMRRLKEKDFFNSYSVLLINATYPQSMYFIVSDKVDSDDMISNQVKVIIGKDDIERKLYLFDNVLKEQLKGELSAVKYIDLRYNKVYLGYKR